jgi:hypothetical protein
VGASGILTLGSTVAGNDSKVVDGGGSAFIASTAVHGLTRDLLTPRMGSRASSRSFPDPIASGGGELVLVTPALSSRVRSKACRNSGTTTAYL